MPEEFLRLGIDPRPAKEGSREYRRAIDEAATATDRLASKVEANAKRETDIYRRAAQERLQLERQLATQRTQGARVNAVAAAEAFVRAQESFYQTNVARIRAAQARGLMSPDEARIAGQQAALEYNNAVLGALDRPQYGQDRQAFTALAGSIKNVEEAGRSAGVGMHRLNNSLIVLARQATGTHPVVGQLVDVVGTFAIGTAAMVPILAGIAAIAAGFNAITRESREAKRELQDAIDRLNELGEARALEAGGGQTAEDIRTVSAELRTLQEEAEEWLRLRRELGEPTFFATQLEANRRQQTALLRSGLFGVSAEDEDEADDQIRELNRLASTRSALIDRRLDDAAHAARAERDLVSVTTEHEERERRRAAERAAAAAEARTDAIEEALARELEAEERTQRRIAAERERQQREEERRVRELERARERAMRGLIRGLYEVGRAFGGTTDQILSMTAAILSLERVPMQSGRDRAVGYGSAALTGAGFGASTGSPVAGGLSGAAGGFMIAGPAGAIIGGVSGIVTGLMEQGARAQRAAAQWKIAFAEFETMFSDLTPTEQRQQQLDRAFAQLVQQAAEAAGVSTSVATIEEARAIVGRFGDVDLGDGMNAFVDHLERLIRQYDQNSTMLGENTDELRNLTSALNAPSGLNLSYYRWLAQGVVPITDPQLPGGGTGPTGGGGSGPTRDGVVYNVSFGPGAIQVMGSGDPRETAEGVRREFERMMVLGGPGPLEMSRR